MRSHGLAWMSVVLLAGLARADDAPRTVITSEPIAKIPAQRTIDFHLLTNRDITRVAILDRFETGRWYISVNDRVWEFYDNLDFGSAQFSPNGKQFALYAQRDNKWFLVQENKELRELGTESPGELLFSPDSTRLATVHTLPGKKQQLAIDGSRSPSTRGSGISCLPPTASTFTTSRRTAPTFSSAATTR